MTETAASQQDCGCPDFHTSRRRFLQGTAALAGGAALSTVTGGVFRQVSYGAAGATNGNVLVVLSLRGGMDGLSMVVPHGDPHYEEARRSLAVPREALLDIDDPMFGLHPALRPLKAMWDDASFGAVHAVGLPQPNRSHFAAMEEMEDADLGSAERRGWLNRMVGLSASNDPLQAVHLGGALVPTSLYGSAPVVATRALKDLGLNNTQRREIRAQRVRSLRRTWNGAGGSLGRAARAALSTAGRTEPLTTPTRIPASYPPGSDLGKALADTARLLRADLGVQTVTLDYGNWDMHVNLGNHERGQMAGMIAELAAALRAFFDDLGPLGGRVTVVTISEFGRRVEMNGGHGLDHGWGNVMLLLGAGVNGGRVHGPWPGLGAGKLVNGDLEVTTDYRTVLREVVTKRFPEVNGSTVFPGFTAWQSETLGVVR